MLEGMTSDELWTLSAFWALFAGFVAMIARSQGRSPVTWFMLSLVLSPLFGFLAVVLTAPRKGPAMTPPPCPRCGVERVSGQRHCPGCGLDLWADYDARRP